MDEVTPIFEGTAWYSIIVFKVRESRKTRQDYINPQRDSPARLDLHLNDVVKELG
jgi:hypothetical protein